MGLLNSLASGITVGEVAGIISGATSIVAQTLPLLITFILIQSIGNRHLNAATWSTTARTLQGTLWPTILRSDSVRTRYVAAPMGIASTALTAIVILLLLVHVLTPLPLVGEVRPDGRSSLASFVYVPDLTFFGEGTDPRPAQPLQRRCGTQVYTDCTPSDELFEKLSSGSVGTTIAGPKDIQFRNFVYYINQTPSGSNSVPIGLNRPMQYLLLNTEYTIVEGAIVDPFNAGIGFRNHTVPVGLEFGATWQEDILWMQPETVCTANNFSIHMPFGNAEVNEFFPGIDVGFNTTDNSNRYVQDDGAFVSRNWSIPAPQWNIYGADSVWNITGPIPDLAQRSFLGAWWDNFWTADALSISANSPLSLGNKYGNDFVNYTSFINPFAITVSNIDGAIFDQAFAYNGWKFLTINLNRFFPGLASLVPNAEASFIFTENFTEYGARCGGYDEGDTIRPLKPYIICGNLYGVPVPEDATVEQSQIGSTVQQPVYTCASSVKATIRTVEFVLNGTAALSNVMVSRIMEKNYTSQADVPLWGVESAGPSQNISSMRLLWGLVNNTYVDDSEISTYRGEAFYLPVASHDSDMITFRDNLAVASVFTAAWNSVYGEAAWLDGISIGGLPSYAGDIQYSLSQKWRNLSRSSDGAASILNLIWTDIVASAVVGTKTGFESDKANTAAPPGTALGTRAVHKHHSVIVYGNLLFAIPAVITLFLWGLLLVVAVFLLATRRVTCAMLIHYMNQTSLGRAVYDSAHPDAAMATSTSEDWASKVGSEPIGIRPYQN